MKRKQHRKVRLRGGGVAYVRHTTKLSDDLIVAMVRHALADVNVGRCAVHITNGEYARTMGRAHFVIPFESSAPRECQHLITIRHFGNVARTVNTIAHEGAHIEDWREGRYRKLTRQRRGERSARRLGYNRQETWKALTSNT